ncbi:MAG: hypothetical protein JO170_10140 [Verrucomicrobia bacterium]|nr:hypothetical protein [Verrucomicrobiota bacterium]
MRRFSRLAAGGNRWTLPIGGGFGKIVKFGKLPVNFQLQAYDNVVTPQRGGADSRKQIAKTHSSRE